MRPENKLALLLFGVSMLPVATAGLLLRETGPRSLALSDAALGFILGFFVLLMLGLSVYLGQVAVRPLYRKRAAAAEAEALEIAAEEFEVAVGELARSLVEAEGIGEISRRLVDGVVRATPCRAAFLVGPGGVLAIRCPDPRREYEARMALQERPHELSWFDLTIDRTPAPVKLAVLPRDRFPFDARDLRKIRILAAQAAFSVHRSLITDRIRQVNRELDHTLQAKQMFLDILSHDLKNPLAAASLRLEVLAGKDPARAAEWAPVARSLERAEDIIEGSLLYSRLESQGAPPERLDLVPLVKEVVEQAQTLADARRVRLQVEAPAGGLPGVASPLLGRAVENFVSNAVKWSPEGSEVTVTVGARDGQCRIAVADHGPGVAPENRGRLFRRFERAERGPVKGTGLGLAIAKRIVDLHGGRVGIDDTPGGGSTFFLEIPSDGTPAAEAPVAGEREAVHA